MVEEMEDELAEAVEETYNLLKENQRLPSGDYLKLERNYLSKICDFSKACLLKDETVIEIEAPVCVVGDIHAQFVYLWKFLNRVGEPPTKKFLFLGDFVDRGINSIEVITLVLCLKLMYPNHIFLIRGNHETPEMTKSYGFLKECEDRYDNDLYQKYLEVFEHIPLAAVINKRMFCVHGGLSKDLNSIDQLREIERPLVIPDSGFIFDILWSDPNKDVKGFGINDSRGGSCTFGPDAAQKFLKDNNLSILIRAHEAVMEGFQFPFKPNLDVLTLFSSPNYFDTLGNSGAVALIDENMMISFHTESPSYFNI